MSSSEDFRERYQRFADSGWSIKPSSYQIRNPDGSVGGWIAQVHLFHETDRNLTVQPLTEKTVRIHGSADEANSIAVALALRWLEENV